MDPIKRQMDAKPVDYGLECRSRSFAFVHYLETRSKSLLDSIHREVDTESNTLRSGCTSFAFLHNIGNAHATKVDTIDMQV